jgi:uncharacterized protein YbaR (Trm112 family)
VIAESHEDPPRPAWSSEQISRLRCPRCIAAGADVRLTVYNDVWLIADCGHKYPIRDGIPIMMVEEGERWMEVEPEDLPVHADAS